jgi:hypothetical protein
MAVERRVAGCVDTVGPDITCPADKRLCAHIGLDQSRVDRVDANAIALAGEFKRGRFGKQRHAALGHRIERVEL